MAVMTDAQLSIGRSLPLRRASARRAMPALSAGVVVNPLPRRACHLADGRHRFAAREARRGRTSDRRPPLARTRLGRRPRHRRGHTRRMCRRKPAGIYTATRSKKLKAAEAVYPCTCTRSDVDAAASAPHLGQEGRSILAPAPIAASPMRHTNPTRQRGNTGLLMPGDSELRIPPPLPRPHRWPSNGEFPPPISATSSSPKPTAHLLSTRRCHRRPPPWASLKSSGGNDLLPSASANSSSTIFSAGSRLQFAHVPLVVGPTAAASPNATATRGYLRFATPAYDPSGSLGSWRTGRAHRAAPIRVSRGFGWLTLTLAKSRTTNSYSPTSTWNGC